ncbi:MAG: nucleotidyltransferase family protein [Flavobacteriales bacterium]|nr:nucleotidyltransferase family protein [Flavobacteriales bacterium]
MTTSNEIFAKLKELKPYLKKEFGVNEIGVFGSFSNETASDSSDIDILVSLDKPIGWKFFGLEIFLEQTFGRKIDLVTKTALKEQLRTQILETVISID